MHNLSQNGELIMSNKGTYLLMVAGENCAVPIVAIDDMNEVNYVCNSLNKIICSYIYYNAILSTEELHEYIIDEKVHAGILESISRIFEDAIYNSLEGCVSKDDIHTILGHYAEHAQSDKVTSPSLVTKYIKHQPAKSQICTNSDMADLAKRTVQTKNVNMILIAIEKAIADNDLEVLWLGEKVIDRRNYDGTVLFYRDYVYITPKALYNAYHYHTDRHIFNWQCNEKYATRGKHIGRFLAEAGCVYVDTSVECYKKRNWHLWHFNPVLDYQTVIPIKRSCFHNEIFKEPSDIPDPNYGFNDVPLGGYIWKGVTLQSLTHH